MEVVQIWRWDSTPISIHVEAGGNWTKGISEILQTVRDLNHSGIWVSFFKYSTSKKTSMWMQWF